MANRDQCLCCAGCPGIVQRDVKLPYYMLELKMNTIRNYKKLERFCV